MWEESQSGAGWPAWCGGRWIGRISGVMLFVQLDECYCVNLRYLLAKNGQTA